MDNNLTDAMRMYFLTVAEILAVFGLIIAYFHYFTIALVPLFFLFMFASAYYRASAREMKRFESDFGSIVFSKFSEEISGTACIRAYELKDRFVSNLRESIEQMNSAKVDSESISIDMRYSLPSLVKARNSSPSSSWPFSATNEHSCGLKRMEGPIRNQDWRVR